MDNARERRLVAIKCGILLGEPTSAFSNRFTDEMTLYINCLRNLRPTIIIFCGHSLGGRLSNEFFVYASKNSNIQPFSITFNAGSVIHANYKTSNLNDDYVNNRILQFHVSYDPLSSTNVFERLLIFQIVFL